MFKYYINKDEYTQEYIENIFSAFPVNDEQKSFIHQWLSDLNENDIGYPLIQFTLEIWKSLLRLDAKKDKDLITKKTNTLTSFLTCLDQTPTHKSENIQDNIAKKLSIFHDLINFSYFLTKKAPENFLVKLIFNYAKNNNGKAVNFLHKAFQSENKAVTNKTKIYLFTSLKFTNSHVTLNQGCEKFLKYLALMPKISPKTPETNKKIIELWGQLNQHQKGIFKNLLDDLENESSKDLQKLAKKAKNLIKQCGLIEQDNLKKQQTIKEEGKMEPLECNRKSEKTEAYLDASKANLQKAINFAKNPLDKYGKKYLQAIEDAEHYGHHHEKALEQLPQLTDDLATIIQNISNQQEINSETLQRCSETIESLKTKYPYKKAAGIAAIIVGFALVSLGLAACVASGGALAPIGIPKMMLGLHTLEIGFAIWGGGCLSMGAGAGLWYKGSTSPDGIKRDIYRTANDIYEYVDQNRVHTPLLHK